MKKMNSIYKKQLLKNKNTKLETTIQEKCKYETVL